MGTKTMTTTVASPKTGRVSLFAIGKDLRKDSRLRETLTCERSRADRGDNQFCLVTFELQRPLPHKRAVTRVAAYLRQRARCIDTVGTISTTVAWLVLPNCDAEAATLLGTKARNRFLRENLVVRLSIYHYQGGIARSIRREDEPDIFHDLAGRQTDVRKRAQTCRGFPLGGSRAQPLAAVLAPPTPVWKRFVDIIGASLGLVLLIPVMCVAAMAIALFSPGPILFAQWRTGRYGVPFRLYKFRSMMIGAEEQRKTLASANERDGPAFKMADDPRVTRVGDVLRRTNLDELPQLWNVLRGDMSLVGPRPLPCQEAADCESWHQERLHVRPGITCLWQTARDRMRVPFPEWMRMDIRYVRGQSLAVDLQLILRTVVRVLQGALSLLPQVGSPRISLRRERA